MKSQEGQINQLEQKLNDVLLSQESAVLSSNKENLAPEQAASTDQHNSVYEVERNPDSPRSFGAELRVKRTVPSRQESSESESDCYFYVRPDSESDPIQEDTAAASSTDEVKQNQEQESLPSGAQSERPSGSSEKKDQVSGATEQLCQGTVHVNGSSQAEVQPLIEPVTATTQTEIPSVHEVGIGTEVRDLKSVATAITPIKRCESCVNTDR